MKINKHIIIILSALMIAGILSSCKTHRDCKGRKKTAKTAMGGWL
jgi:hypothetical protein